MNSSSSNKADSKVEWVKDLPPNKPLQLECILDTKTIKKIRKKTYKEYLVKWQGLLEVEAIWMTEEDIIKHGTTLQHLATQGT